MKPTDKPLMRLDLSVGLAPDGSGALITDPLFGRTHPFDKDALSLVRLFDGRRSVQQLTTLPGVTRNALNTLLRRLEQAQLLQTNTTRPLVEAAQLCYRLARPIRPPMFKIVRAGSLGETALRFHPSQRHNCQGSGHCCRLGAVVLDTRQRQAIAGHDWRGQLTELPALQPIAHTASSDKLFLVEQDADGRCAFLSHDTRCKIHAALGETLKPSPCRLFPRDLVVDRETLLVLLHQECASYDRSFATGTPLAESESELREIVRSNPAMQLRALPARVRVGGTPAVTVALDHYHRAEDRWLSELECAKSLADFVARYLPAELLALATTGDTGEAPPGNGQAESDALAAADAVLLNLEGLVTAQHSLSTAGAGALRNRRFRNPAFALRVVKRLRRRLPRHTLALQDADLTRDERAYLRQYLANFLWGKTLFYYPSLAHGLAALRLVVALAGESRPIWSSREDADCDAHRHFHQSLTYWTTLFRFPEYQHLLGQISERQAQHLLHWKGQSAA